MALPEPLGLHVAAAFSILCVKFVAQRRVSPALLSASLLFRAERGRAPPRGLAPTMGVVYPLHARALMAMIYTQRRTLLLDMG
jgi:hypothetical protein